MNQMNNDKSIDDVLRDTKHNAKAKVVFLKLLAKQKSKQKDWSDVRTETYPAKEIKPGADDVY